MDQKSKYIVQCPFCQTEFYVWLDLLLSKRRVRCSKCENTWFQDPEDCLGKIEKLPKESSPKIEEPQPVRDIKASDKTLNTMEPLPSFETQEDDSNPQPYQKKKTPLVSLIAFLIPIAVFIVARDFIAQQIPLLSYVYRAIGLPLKSAQEGFEIRNTAWFETIDQGIPSVAVSGELTNMSSRVKSAPAIRVTLKGTGGCHPMDFASRLFGDDKAIGPDGTCVVDQWTVNVSYDRLLPGQVVPFSTTHPYDERSQVSKVKIDFVE